jgi:hypothetical protein
MNGSYLGREEPQMRLMMLVPVVLVGCFLHSKAVIAKPISGKCSGVLHQVKGDIMFGGGKGEDEGICIVNKLEVSKILATCRVGSYCLVEGLVDDCKDSGECTELTNVTSVRRGVSGAVEPSSKSNVVPQEMEGIWVKEKVECPKLDRDEDAGSMGEDALLLRGEKYYKHEQLCKLNGPITKSCCDDKGEFTIGQLEK